MPGFNTRFQWVKSCANTCQLTQEVTDNQQSSTLWWRKEKVSFKFWEGAHEWHCSSQHKWPFYCHSLFISDFASAQANWFTWIPCPVCSCILEWHLLIWMQLNSTSNPHLRQFCQAISSLQHSSASFSLLISCVRVVKLWNEAISQATDSETIVWSSLWIWLPHHLTSLVIFLIR